MPRILVVDDSPVDRQWLAALLSHAEQAEILEAQDGLEAFSMATELQPDLVLTDMQMPNLDGLQLVRMLREKSPQIPVILITAHGSEELALEALRAGAASYVNKDWGPSRLLPTVRQVLAATRQNRELSRLNPYLVYCHFCFVLETDCQLMRPLLDFLHQHLTCLCLDAADITRITIAVQEALSNAIFHGNLELPSELRQTDEEQFFHLAKERLRHFPYSARRIYFEGALSRKTITFVIRDEGPGFDPNSLPDPHDPKIMECPCGRGLLLIRSFMDEVSFNQQGNEIRLVKYVSRQ